MKKLWQRSKSRVRGNQTERSGSGAVTSQNATRTSATSTSHNVPAVPSLPQRSAKRESTTAAAPVPRPGSSNRIQPMLIGISRPSGTFSRPGTAGSLQDAVDQAANNVAQNPQSPNRVPQISSTDNYKGHNRTKSPRYVDIFAVQNPNTSMASYNEDVASRNIDVKRVAEDYKPLRYVPNSKYQEEVAERNAHAHTKSSSAINYEDLPLRQEAVRSQSANEVGYYVPPDRLADAEDIRRLHHAQLGALRQPKFDGGSNNAAYTQPVPARHPSRPSQDLHIPYETAAANLSPPRTSADLRGQPRASPVQQAGIAQSLQPLTTSSLNTVAATSPLPGYRLSQSELFLRDADFRVHGQPNHSQRADNPDRSASLLSNASSARRAINLQHRTIMDLTGEDDEVFSDGYPESDMSKSPVVDQAHVDLYRRGRPEVVSSGGRVRQKDGAETAAQKEVEEATPPVNSNLTARQQGSGIHQPISFSTINTIATVSPSVQLNGTPLVSTDKVLSSPTKPGTRGKATKLYTLSETEPETEGFPTRAEEPTQPLSKSPPTLSASDTGTKVPSPERKAIATGQELVPTLVQTPQLSATAESTPKGIEMSPESLQSRDFTEPSRAFGVLTRDFATTPTRSTQTVRSDREPNTKAKVQHKAPVTVGAATRAVEHLVPNGISTSSSSTFDEDEFRLKQEKARAALVKLQQSLNEEFIPPPKAARPAPRVSSRNRSLSSPSNEANDGRPVNPSSGFTQVRDFHAPRPPVNGDIRPRTSSNKHKYSSTQDRPSSSARPHSSASTATVKPIRRHRSPPSQSHQQSQSLSQTREADSSLNEMRRLAEEMRNPRLGSPVLQQPHSFVPKQNGNMNINRFSSSTNSTTSTGDVLPSPGELSLSSFPAPSSVQHSRHVSLNLPIQNPADVSPPNSNRNSAQSQGPGQGQTLLRQATHANFENRAPTSAPAPTVGGSNNIPPIYQIVATTTTKSPTPNPHISRLQRDSQSQPYPYTHTSSSSAPQSVLPQSPGAASRKSTSRRGSMQSQTSALTNSSQFSIPYHLIPERGSSMRDSLVKEVDDEI